MRPSDRCRRAPRDRSCSCPAASARRVTNRSGIIPSSPGRVSTRSSPPTADRTATAGSARPSWALRGCANTRGAIHRETSGVSCAPSPRWRSAAAHARRESIAPRARTVRRERLDTPACCHRPVCRHPVSPAPPDVTGLPAPVSCPVVASKGKDQSARRHVTRGEQETAAVRGHRHVGVLRSAGGHALGAVNPRQRRRIHGHAPEIADLLGTPLEEHVPARARPAEPPEGQTRGCDPPFHFRRQRWTSPPDRQAPER